MSPPLHIVSFNVPYPANYGGVIDVFYKLKALSEAGVRITLHCFEYGREEAPLLEQYCDKVFYYKRFTGIRHALSALPYIVKSRSHKALLNNLLADDSPILFEGLHSTFWLQHPDIQKRKILIRTHNIEHDYYSQLAKTESNLLKKNYFYIEARRLKRYETILNKAQHILAISPNDTAYFSAHYRPETHFIPAFHPYQEVTAQPGKGRYALYHGNLSVAENVKAAFFLIRYVFSYSPVPLVIAGRNPHRMIKKAAQDFPHISIVPNPTDTEMQKLLHEAHIHVLPTFQDTGLKLKLLAAIYSGRYCLTNSLMVNNTGLEPLCEIADTPKEFIDGIEHLFSKTLLKKQISERKKILGKKFSLFFHAKKILHLVENKEITIG